MQEVPVFESCLELMERPDLRISILVDDLPESLERYGTLEMKMKLDLRGEIEDVGTDQVTPAALASLTASDIGPSQMGP